jgi:sarcosine oxidase delta subunit
VIRAVTYSAIECDGCQQRLKGDFSSATEARAAAYADGWRFPLRVNASGDAVRSRANDVCGECLPDWIPRLDRSGAASAARADARARSCPTCGAKPREGCVYEGETKPRRWHWMHDARMEAS